MELYGYKAWTAGAFQAARVVSDNAVKELRFGTRNLRSLAL